MRTKGFVVLSFFVLLLVCSHHRSALPVFGMQHPTDAEEHVLGPDIVQRTCALEVVLPLRDDMEPRLAHAREEFLAPEDAQPNGTTLACLPPPTE